MPKRPRGRPPTDHTLDVRLMYRGDATDVALLDALVTMLRDERDASPEPSSAPTRGSVLRWLVRREAKARGIVIPAAPTKRPTRPLRQA